MYGWTYNEIVEHNRFQLWEARKGAVPDTIQFKTMEEALAYQMKIKK